MLSQLPAFLADPHLNPESTLYPKMLESIILPQTENKTDNRNANFKNR